MLWPKLAAVSARMNVASLDDVLVRSRAAANPGATTLTGTHLGRGVTIPKAPIAAPKGWPTPASGSVAVLLLYEDESTRTDLLVDDVNDVEGRCRRGC